MTILPLGNAAKFYLRLNTFRTMDDVFVDVILACEYDGAHFKCHWLVLVGASDYFKARLGSSCKEHTVKNVVLDEVSTATLQKLLQFACTGDARIHCNDFWDVIRASAFHHLPDLQDACILFVTQSIDEFTALTFLNLLYSYAYARKEDVPTGQLHSNLADRPEIFSQADESLQLPFDALNEIIKDRLSADEIGHLCKDRFEYDASWLIKFILSENTTPIPSDLTRMNVYICEALALGPSPSPPIVESEDLRPVITEIHDPSMVLHLYVRYASENIIRIFTIEDVTDEVCIHSGQFPVVNSGQYFTTSVFNDDLLLRLHFPGEDGVPPAIDEQTFHIHPSADMQVSVPLRMPPLIFTSVSVCQVRNVMFAYHESLVDDPVRTVHDHHSRVFDDEEIRRGIYAYNCDVDHWFPVPEMKERVKWAGMTALGDTLILVGGVNQNYVQAFDGREGIWRELPGTNNVYFNAAACCLRGKVYVFGGFDSDYCERYDPVACRWERMHDIVDFEQLNPKAITYRHGMLLFDRDKMRISENGTTGHTFDYQEGAYYWNHESPGGQLFSWDVRAADLMFENPTHLVDSVVFKRIGV